FRRASASGSRTCTRCSGSSKASSGPCPTFRRRASRRLTSPANGLVTAKGVLATAVPRGAAVAMHGITKRFPGVLANDAVDFEAAPGEVHALLGENGAGKSTLSNILTGLYQPDEGEIRLYGEAMHFRSPSDAID